MLRKAFGPKRDEITGEWNGLHNEKLYALYSLPNTIWVIKSRRMRWVGMWHISETGEVPAGVLWRDLRVRTTC